MKYILTKKQYNVINEALGVPENIHEAAIEFYEIFLENLKSIAYKEEQYEFSGYSDITLGDKKKVKVDKYTLLVRVHELDDFNEQPKVASMGMEHKFKFNRELLMSEVPPSTEANFSIDFAVSNDWEPHQLYDEFKNNRIEYISSLAHELKHKYDKQVKPIDLLGKESEYSAIMSIPSFRIPVIDEKFKKYMYYTNVAENLVRATEVASLIKSRNITKEQFREFLENDKNFKTLVEIKNFTYKKFMNELSNSIDEIEQVLGFFKTDYSKMSKEEKINEFLRVFYVGLANSKLNIFHQYIQGPMDGIASLFRAFGGMVNTEEVKTQKVMDNFIKYVSKYENNPNQFYIDEIKKFNDVANQMIKKLSKLYAMTSDNKTNESIINWGLYLKINDKNNLFTISEDNVFSKKQVKNGINIRKLKK
jgi:hypothetical protein